MRLATKWVLHRLGSTLHYNQDSSSGDVRARIQIKRHGCPNGNLSCQGGSPENDTIGYEMGSSPVGSTLHYNQDSSSGDVRARIQIKRHGCPNGNPSCQGGSPENDTIGYEMGSSPAGVYTTLQPRLLQWRHCSTNTNKTTRMPKWQHVLLGKFSQDQVSWTTQTLRQETQPLQNSDLRQAYLFYISFFSLFI